MSFKKDNIYNFSVGQFCISKSGRDNGMIYVIYKIIDQNYVLLVNGKEKTITNPKRKNVKHLQKVNDGIVNFEKDINSGNINDLDIKRFIKLKTSKEAKFVK